MITPFNLDSALTYHAPPEIDPEDSLMLYFWTYHLRSKPMYLRRIHSVSDPVEILPNGNALEVITRRYSDLSNFIKDINWILEATTQDIYILTIVCNQNLIDPKTFTSTKNYYIRLAIV